MTSCGSVKGIFVACDLIARKKRTLRGMESNNAQEVSPVRFSTPGNSTYVCWKHAKLIEDDNPRIMKRMPNYAH